MSVNQAGLRSIARPNAEYNTQQVIDWLLTKRSVSSTGMLMYDSAVAYIRAYQKISTIATEDFTAAQQVSNLSDRLSEAQTSLLDKECETDKLLEVLQLVIDKYLDGKG